MITFIQVDSQSTFIHSLWLICVSMMWETSTSNTKHALSDKPLSGSLLKEELKSNSSSATLTLSGGMYGHLGLLLTSQQYATLSEEEFKSPTKPGGTEAQIRRACEVWEESHIMFHLYQAVERALIAQVVAVMDPPYLAPLKNTNTSQYWDKILKILQHLSTTYSHITSKN